MLRVLGPLEVDAVRGTTAVGGPVPRRLLCALVARVGETVSIDSLLDAAWGDDPPPSAEASLRSHITRLREAIGSTGDVGAVEIERRDPGYRLVAERGLVDASVFESMVDGEPDERPEQAVRRLRDALALWRGPTPYVELGATAYPAAQAARLTELRGAAGERLVAALLDAGDDVGAATECEQLLRDDPYRESLWEHLVIALYRQGRQADALGAYRRARSELDDGLGIEPGPRLKALEQRVLGQDQALDRPPAPPSRIPCPYKGLARYEVGDAALFVGREGLIEDLVSRLVDGRLVVVVGPSGAGKSSLVRAGLIPALAAGAVQGSASWTVRTIVPGTDPVAAVGAALADGPDLLVVDQAEEAFLAGDGRWTTAVGDALVAATAGGVRVVLVLRADFYGRLADHAALARRAGPATVLVAAPDDGALRRIVVEPAAAAGLTVDADLVGLVVSEVSGRPGALPVLSTALVRTWEHREGATLTVESYRAGGGVAGALQRVGEEAWADLDGAAQEAAARRILIRLATYEEGAWVRRRARHSELVPEGDEAAGAALAVLADRRIVITRADDVEIAHEALLTGWPRLGGWLEDGRASAEVRDRLTVAAGAWNDGGRDPAELYRGTRLAAAAEVATDAPQDLTPLELDYVRESRAEYDREITEATERADREARGRTRTRAVAGGLAVALVLAGVAGGFAVRQGRAAAEAAVLADAQRLGVVALSGGALDRSLLLAAQAVRLDPSPETEGNLFAALLRSDAASAVMRVDSEPEVAWAPDGATFVSQSVSGVLQTWSASGGDPLAEFDLDDLETFPRSIARLPDGRVLVGVGAHPGVVDPATGTVGEVGPGAPGAWALSPDSETLVGAGVDDDGTLADFVHVWALGSSPSSASTTALGARISWVTECGAAACVLTESNELLRIGYADGTIESRAQLGQPSLDDQFVASPDGTVAAVTGTDFVVRLLDTRTGVLVRELAGSTADNRVLDFSSDGSMLAGRDGATVLLWRLGVGPVPERLTGHGSRVSTASFSPDGSTLATGSADRTLALWDVQGPGRFGSVLTTGLSAPTSTVWAAGSTIVVGQVGGSLEFVDPATGSLRGPSGVNPHIGADYIYTARSGWGSDRVVVADSSGVTAVWSLDRREVVAVVQVPMPDGPYTPGVWVSPDGATAATLRDDNGIRLIDMQDGALLAQLPPLPAAGQPVVVAEVQGWTGDGRGILLTRRFAGTDPVAELVVVDARTGAVLAQAPLAHPPTEAVSDVSGDVVAVGLENGQVQFFDARTGAALAPPAATEMGYVANVSAAPGGGWFSASGGPPEVVLWDARTLRQVGSPLPLDVAARDARARFAADGRLIVASEKTVRAFTIDPAAWLERACRLAGRVLTEAEFAEFLPGRPYDPACQP